MSVPAPASPDAGPQRHRVVLPAIPALSATAKTAAILTTDGEVKLMPHAQVQVFAHRQPVLVCHAPYTRARLGAEELLAFDLLELFAFVHPATFCVPTPVGLARALGLSLPRTVEDYPLVLVEAAQALLADLAAEPRAGNKCDPLEIARAMGRQGEGWVWTPYVFAAFGVPYETDQPIFTKAAMNVWKHLPEWSEQAPPPPPAHHPVTGEESRARLAQLLGEGARHGKERSEARPQQMDYATRLTAAFEPAERENEPHLVLAEAGTGTGKTLGYLAPASVWAEKNGGSVWISTYTKNLQRQISQELDLLYPDPALKDKKIAVRKGRENYLCLLNLEDAVTAAALARSPQKAVAAGLMARWAAASRDGDLQGGDFPGWLPGLLGNADTTALSDRRGECVFSACDHYHRCFVEKAVRKSQRADIVIANHALVMIQTALADPGQALPQRYVFDEGHHLFDAADSAFAGHLTARETGDLRRWIVGAEDGRKSRARGLRRRIEDLIAGDDAAEADLTDIVHTAHALAGPGWSRRLRDGKPTGTTEQFLLLVYRQVMARAQGRDGPYSIETDTRPLIEGLPEAAAKLRQRLRDLQRPMRGLSSRLKQKLADDAAKLDSDTRRRIESVASGLDRRAENEIGGWLSMLETLEDMPAAAGADFVDWMGVERVEGRAYDLGLYRHWVDPMKPFAAALRPHAQGIAVTSATLRDGTGSEEEDWHVAEERTGAPYLSDASSRVALPSPFDYAARTRIFVVTDVDKNDPAQVAAACRTLFEASGGGGLGLFTAIQRLRFTHGRIAAPLEEKDIHLYAQHIDEIDTGTLVDIFREDTHACLLGTDAVRDGIDVPGESLRLLVYDRVPWPRPSILHRARRAKFGGQRYDDLITRLKLRQAYGRLIRSAADTGVFVLLDSALPSRLHGAFPEGVAVERLGLAEAARETAAFLGRGGGA
jgi:ATP-dependent DNA helicase DinG